MTVGPNTQDKNKIRKAFSLLREIKENINKNVFVTGNTYQFCF